MYSSAFILFIIILFGENGGLNFLYEFLQHFLVDLCKVWYLLASPLFIFEGCFVCFGNS